MGILNALNNITVYGQTYDVYLNWIGKIIEFLIENIGSVGIGIIVFSLILKFIVLPFDIYQRISMRKQNLQMKENQARMEKLQKQYANNKELYNQKVMEMYKENGVSMFSSCLPMILSMVIFFVAIDAFNVYAQYSTIKNYNIMVDAYNAKIISLCPDLNDKTVSIEGNTITVKADDSEVFYTLQTKEGVDYKENDYEYIRTLSNKEKTFFSNTEKGDAYYVDLAKQAVVEVYNTKVLDNTKFFWIQNIWKPDAMYQRPITDYKSFSSELSAAGCGSRSDGVQFFVDGKKMNMHKISESKTNAYTMETYDAVTEKLNEQKTKQSNGYFILIALSIGSILLQQFVTMRSQKEQQQYATVDGQGASQQKMTMIIMTGMFAIFSFMYSSAFSIYMVTSNLFSLASTLIINKAVDKAEEKKERKAIQEKHNQRFPGRVAPTDKKDKKD